MHSLIITLILYLLTVLFPCWRFPPIALMVGMSALTLEVLACSSLISSSSLSDSPDVPEVVSTFLAAFLYFLLFLQLSAPLKWPTLPQWKQVMFLAEHFFGSSQLVDEQFLHFFFVAISLSLFLVFFEYLPLVLVLLMPDPLCGSCLIFTLSAPLDAASMVLPCLRRSSNPHCSLKAFSLRALLLVPKSNWSLTRTFQTSQPSLPHLNLQL